MPEKDQEFHKNLSEQETDQVPASEHQDAVETSTAPTETPAEAPAEQVPFTPKEVEVPVIEHTEDLPSALEMQSFSKARYEKMKTDLNKHAAESDFVEVLQNIINDGSEDKLLENGSENNLS